jgi:hypothetical protein
VHRAPGFPCALYFSRGTLSAQLGRHRRENAQVYLLFDN